MFHNGSVQSEHALLNKRSCGISTDLEKDLEKILNVVLKRTLLILVRSLCQ